MKKLIFVCAIFFLLCGGASAARLHVFVNIDYRGTSPVYFKVKSLNLLDEGGNPVSVPVSKPLITTKVPFGQNFLASAEVPEGAYKGVSLEIEGAGRGAAKFDNATGLDVKIPANWELKEGESRCLFLTWDVQASLREGAFRPVLYAMPQERPLRGETLYVTCDEINTLFVIRTDTNRVVASLATKESPKEMATFPRSDRLYVLCEGSRSLLSIELSTFRVIDSLVLPMVLRPRFLTMIDGRTLAITDPPNDQIILVAAASGSLLKSRRLGHRLMNVVYWKEGEQLFVSSTGEQKVYQLDRALRTVRAYDTGLRPRGIWAYKSWLYVADSGSGTVSLFNLRTGRLVGRVRSGREPIYILGTQRRLYISNQGEGTLGILWPGQMAISKRIRVGGTPSMLAVCKVRRWVYAVDRAGKGIVVVNATSLKKAGSIVLGNLPYGIAIAR